MINEARMNAQGPETGNQCVRPTRDHEIKARDNKQDAQRVAAGSSFTQDLDTESGLRDRRFVHALRNCAQATARNEMMMDQDGCHGS